MSDILFEEDDKPIIELDEQKIKVLEEWARKRGYTIVPNHDNRPENISDWSDDDWDCLTIEEAMDRKDYEDNEIGWTPLTGSLRNGHVLALRLLNLPIEAEKVEHLNYSEWRNWDDTEKKRIVDLDKALDWIHGDEYAKHHDIDALKELKNFAEAKKVENFTFEEWRKWSNKEKKRIERLEETIQKHKGTHFSEQEDDVENSDERTYHDEYEICEDDWWSPEKEQELLAELFKDDDTDE